MTEAAEETQVADDPLAQEVDVCVTHVITEIANRELQKLKADGETDTSTGLIASIFTGAWASVLHFYWRFKDPDVSTDQALDGLRDSAAQFIPQVEERLAQERAEPEAESPDPAPPVPPTGPKPGEPGWLASAIQTLIVQTAPTTRDGGRNIQADEVLGEIAMATGMLLAGVPTRPLRRQVMERFIRQIAQAQAQAIAAGQHPKGHVMQGGHA